jgi:hypothetical protein
VTTIAVRRSKIIFGTEGGLIGQIDMMPSPSAFTEIRQIRHTVTRILTTPRGQLLAMDDRGNGIFLSEGDEWMSVPCTLKNAVLCGSMAILARVHGEKCLRTVPIHGGLHTPPTPLAAAMNLGRWGSTSGSPPEVREEIRILRNALARAPQFRARATRYYFLLKEFRAAQDFLLASETGPLFVANVMKAIVIASGASAAIELGTAQFTGRGFVDEAIDLCLMTDNWSEAVSVLIGMGRLSDAAIICRVQEPSELRTQLMTSLAKRMLAGGMHAYGTLLFAELGSLEAVTKQFSGYVTAAHGFRPKRSARKA